MNIDRDIVDEILSGLPVKSLKRFEVVCKDWYFHIHSDYFKAKHLKHQKTKEKTLIYHKQSELLLNWVFSICSEQEKEEDHDDDEGDDRRTLFYQDQQYLIEDLPLHHLEYYLNGVRLIGSCNGLVCLECGVMKADLTSDRIINLWNPATRDFRTLPSWKPQQPSIGTRLDTLRSHHIEFGFGCTSNDYKVILIVFCKKQQRFQQHIKSTMIYSLNTNSWRELDYSNVSAEISSIRDYGNTHTISLHDNVYRMNLAFDILHKPVLLFFDMGKEVFQLTPLPLALSDKFNYRDLEFDIEFDIEFFTLHESVALVIHETRDTTKSILEIWTTKELEQGRTSWIKALHIVHASKIDKTLGFRKCKNSDDFLFLFSHYINHTDCCKGNNKAMKGIYVNNRGEIKDETLVSVNNIVLPLKVLAYVETLVSVKRP